MPDFALCSGKDCPIKDNCKRYKVRTADPWQSWMEPPYQDGKCEMFLEYKPTNKQENTIK